MSLVDREEALRRLVSGEVIACATEYSYALCADARSEAATATVLSMKGRRATLPLVVGDIGQLAGLILEVPPVVYDLQYAFWPGPLTLIMKGCYGLPSAIVGDDRGVAVRIPGWAPLAELSTLLDRPLTATSANPTGSKPAFTPQEVEDWFPGLPVYSENLNPNPQPSTLADVRRGIPEVLRTGMIQF